MKCRFKYLCFVRRLYVVWALAGVRLRYPQRNEPAAHDLPLTVLQVLPS